MRRGPGTRTLRAAGVVGLLALALALPTCRRGPRTVEIPPQRILLVVIDTLRRDYVSAYADHVATPHIDALARDGQIFPDVLASFHQTTMSMAALFTGHTPSLERGVDRKRFPLSGRSWCGLLRFAARKGDDDCIPRSVPTLAERMAQAGYWTAGVVSNQLLFRPGGYERGFARWVEVGGRPPTATDTNREVAKVLAERPSDHFFLYVHYMDVHDYGMRGEPYASGPPIVDAGVGELLDLLDDADVLDGTLVVLTADHGERLGEPHFLRGTPGHNGNPSFEALLHIPLVVSPAVFPPNAGPIRSEDIHRMLLQIAGAAPGPEPELAPGELYLSELHYQTYRRGRWKSMRDRRTGRLFLVDLENDPEESLDVARAHPDVAAEHAARIDALSRALGDRDAPEVGMSEADRKRLEALGYVRMIERPRR